MRRKKHVLIWIFIILAAAVFLILSINRPKQAKITYARSERANQVTLHFSSERAETYQIICSSGSFQKTVTTDQTSIHLKLKGGKNYKFRVRGIHGRMHGKFSTSVQIHVLKQKMSAEQAAQTAIRRLHKGQGSIVINFRKDSKAIRRFETALLRDNGLSQDGDYIYTEYLTELYSLTYYHCQNGQQSFLRAKFVNCKTNIKKETKFQKRIRKITQKTIAGKQSDYEKVKAIYSYVMKHVTYDYSITNYSAYDAFETGTSVCEGYAMLFYIMCRDAGIPCRYAVGHASGSIGTDNSYYNHSWNLVKIDGKWYQCDATWDDRGDSPHYTYFLKGRSMSLHGTPKSEYRMSSLPEIAASDYAS